MIRAFLAVLAVSLTVTPVRAEDNWPHWRGPLVNGVSPNGDPPIRWDENTNIKWKVAIPGRGTSTPIVWGDQVFVLTAIDTGKAVDPAGLPKDDPQFEKKTKSPGTVHQFVVLSLDRQTGKERWRRTAIEAVPHEGHHPTHCYAAGSPTTDGKFLYVSFGSRGAYCYDLAGKLQWQRQLGLLNTRLGWGEAVTPTIHRDTLLVNHDQEAGSFLIALDARTGQPRWKVDRDEVTTWATPLVVEHKGRTQVIISATKKVRSYDLATGQVIWECAGQTTNVIPSPIARDGVVYCVSGYKGNTADAISLDSVGDVSDKLIWHHGKGTPYVSSPLLYGDRLYFTYDREATLTSLDIKTGKPVIDRARIPGMETIYASPTGAAGRIYLADRAGTTAVIKNADKFEIIATNKLDDSIDASPVIVGKTLFLRGEKFLYCIEEK